MVMDKSRILETSLVLTTAFIVAFLISDQQVFIYMAAGFGFIGIFLRPIAGVIAKGWFALAEGLNFVVSKLILGALFFLLLTPVSFFYRMFHRDKLLLGRNHNSTWRIREKTYNHEDLKNIW
jgi:hypothetical protein